MAIMNDGFTITRIETLARFVFRVRSNLTSVVYSRFVIRATCTHTSFLCSSIYGNPVYFLIRHLTMAAIVTIPLGGLVAAAV